MRRATGASEALKEFVIEVLRLRLRLLGSSHSVVVEANNNNINTGSNAAANRATAMKTTK